jgi:hypothetical protein
LEELDVSNNKLSNVEGLEYVGATAEEAPGLPELHTRDLSGHSIKRRGVSSLSILPKLRHLNLASNCLESIAHLAKCTKLVTVKLDHNQLGNVRQCEFLQDLEHLRELNLGKGNCGLGEIQHFRARVVVRLQQITALDGNVVSAEEKVKALNLHGADLMNRERVFRKHMPSNELFVNLLPPFEEPENEPISDEKGHEEEVAGLGRRVSAAFVNNVLSKGIRNDQCRKKSIQFVDTLFAGLVK